jgi:hypothetical protein
MIRSGEQQVLRPALTMMMNSTNMTGRRRGTSAETPLVQPLTSGALAHDRRLQLADLGEAVKDEEQPVASQR